MMYLGGRVAFTTGGLVTLVRDMRTVCPSLFTGVPRLLTRVSDHIRQNMSSEVWRQHVLDAAVTAQLQLANK